MLLHSWQNRIPTKPGPLIFSLKINQNLFSFVYILINRWVELNSTCLCEKKHSSNLEILTEFENTKEFEWVGLANTIYHRR